ncbi:SLBB domain-containing protein, partial [Candidatus Marinimicrobia bacterium]|nr:SLBB domain-containing protein [Candidatus Neomarinimicrobiota bacterium]
SLPSPSNYLLGPGDELIISIWGATQLRKTYIISKDGKIYDENVGQLNLLGMTLSKSKNSLISQYGRIYSTLVGENPTSYLDVSLGEIKSINITFVGQIKYPGVYPVHPFSSVVTGLIQAGGIDTTGTLRNIIIKRDGLELAQVDFYNYLINGNIYNNIQLRDQDVIIVPTRNSTVMVDSAVVRPGIYESKEGNTIFDMIQYAGGLKSNSSSLIGIKRIAKIAERNPETETIQNYYINYNNSNLSFSQDGDVISVHPIFDTIKKVEIIGQVKRPGYYNYYNGMSLQDLIKLGGGFNDSTFLKSVYLKRAEIIRMNPVDNYEKIIEINLNNLLIEKTFKPILLENLDRFVVHSNRYFFEKENIKIAGEVLIPGEYPLLSDDETLQSILDRAGGFTKNSLKEGISIYRDKKYFDEANLKKPELQVITNKENDENSEENSKFKETRFESLNKNEKIRVAWQNMAITLMPGDSIIFKERTGTVNLTGEVYNPGLIEFQKGKSLNYYIKAAGGTTPQGNKRDILIVYANGVVSPNKFIGTPKVRDGATIVINRKNIVKPFNIVEFTTTTLSLISSTVTVLVLAQNL